METLADLIERHGPLAERDAVGWVIRLAKRVERLHGAGAAHGGICAASVRVSGGGCASPGEIVPSADPRHPSPERRGGAGPSRSDDTWAAAATLYHLLTGAEASATPTPLAAFGVGDAELQGIVDRFLEPSLVLREVSMSGLREALERWRPDERLGDLPALVDAAPAAGGAVPLLFDAAAIAGDELDVTLASADAETRLSPPASPPAAVADDDTATVLLALGSSDLSAAIEEALQNAGPALAEAAARAKAPSDRGPDSISAYLGNAPSVPPAAGSISSLLEEPLAAATDLPQLDHVLDEPAAAPPALASAPPPDTAAQGGGKRVFLAVALVVLLAGAAALVYLAG